VSTIDHYGIQATDKYNLICNGEQHISSEVSVFDTVIREYS